MSQPLIFDTLEYAKMLAAGGIMQPDLHAESLAHAMSQNIYIRTEVDKMFEAAMKRSDENSKKFDQSVKELRETVRKSINSINIALQKEHNFINQRIQEMKLEIKELEVRLEKRMARFLVATISILGSLIVLVGAISTFAHAFVH